MEIQSNKTLYVIVGVLGIIIVALLVALITFKKPKGNSPSLETNNTGDSSSTKTLQELTTAPENNSNTEVNEQLQKMISAPSPEDSSANNNKAEAVNANSLNAPSEEQPMSKELQDSLTAPSQK